MFYIAIPWWDVYGCHEWYGTVLNKVLYERELNTGNISIQQITTMTYSCWRDVKH